jgi:hypothetical protein
MYKHWRPFMLKKTCKRILCLDGGGIWGALSTQFLVRLETALEQPLWKCFDMVAGTSVGAIQAAPIAFGRPVHDIIQLFKDTDKHWRKNWFPPAPFGPKWKRDPIVNTLRDLLGQNAHINEAKIQLMTTTVERCSDLNIFYRSWDKDCDILAVDAVARSFAAAYYFGQIVDKAKQMVYADGGEGNANCPLFQCIIEMKKQKWHQGDGCYIMSVGCGFKDESQTFKDASTDTMFGQVAQVIDLARSQAIQTYVKDAEVNRDDIPDRFDFNRFDIQLPKYYGGLDDIAHVNDFISFGNSMYNNLVKPELIDFLRR